MKSNKTSTRNRAPMFESLEGRQFYSTSTATSHTPAPAPKPPTPPITVTIDGESTQNPHGSY